MSLLRSKAMRVFYKNSGGLSDLTEQARTWTAPYGGLPYVAATDSLLLGQPHKFSSKYVAMQVANSVAAQMTVSYWNGLAWVPFTDLLDETSGFQASGFIQWEEKPEWQACESDLIPELSTLSLKQKMFWVKITFSADLDALTSFRAIKTMFSDDRQMQVIHPEIMQYLPSSQTDFLPQHELAKDRIVNHLIRTGLIKYEDQIKNPEDWLLACSYMAVVVILEAIPGDDKLTQVKKDYSEAAVDMIKLVAASLDKNESEVLEDNEKDPGFMGSIGLSRR